MSDFQLKVVADTQDAERKLDAVDKAATNATKERNLKINVPSVGSISKGFEDISKSVKEAANNIKTLYTVAKNIPGVGENIKLFEDLGKSTVKTTQTLSQNIKTADILKNSFETAGSTIERVVNNLAKLGFALYGVKEIVGLLQNAYKGFFDQTIGREIKLRETILKTQTTLASTSKVFKNGKEITDPYQKIVTLTSEVAKNIDSIRERSIELAGVTSNDVIEVFGIVASQIGQVGGGLKEAEDLAINFAAALGTFDLPLYQANQEIGSILRGDISQDSYLARSLGITNQDIAKAKGQAGGVIKFIQDKLAASVAGQKIAAQGFSGVISNIRDLAELAGQRFGSGLLDPLLNTITKVFEQLNKVRNTIFDIAEGAGKFVGRFNALGLTVAEKVQARLAPAPGATPRPESNKLVEDAKRLFERAVAFVESALQRATEAFANIIAQLQPAFMAVTDAFGRLIKVFLQVRVNIFESLVSAVSNLVTAATPLINVLAQTFNLYSRFLALPVIQRLSELKAQYDLLKRAGLDFITNAILIGQTLFRVVIPAVGGVRTAIGIIIVSIGGLITAIGSLTLTVSGIVLSLSSLPALAGAAATAMTAFSQQLQSVSTNASQAGARLTGLGNGFTALGVSAKAAGLQIIKSLGWVFAIQAGITLVVDAIGKYQREQEDLARSRRADQALKELTTTYKQLGDNIDFATKAQKEYKQQLADAEYNRTTTRLEEIRARLNDLKYETQDGIQTWGEFWRALDPSTFPGRLQGIPSAQSETGRLIAEQKRLEDFRRKYSADKDREDLKNNIRIAAQDRTNLEKEINALRRQQETDLFQLRQQLASKEVEIFRAAGELRIFQMEQANKKLLEGEEGASAAALEALNTYLSTRERGELSIEAEKKQLIIEGANLQRQIEDYRFQNEQKIQELKKAGAKYEQEVADYRLQAARQAAQAQTEAGAGSPSQAAAATGATGALSQLISERESFGGNYGAFNRGGSNNGHTAHGSGIDPNLVNMTIAEIQRRQLAPGVPANQQLHAVGKYQIIGSTLRALMNGRYGPIGVSSTDKFTPEVQERLFLALARNRIVPGNVAATENGLKQEWIGLQYANPAKLRAATQQLMAGGGSAAAAPPPPLLPPRAPTLDAVGAPAVAKYAEAVRRLASALDRARALQEALTNAQTKAAFDEIAKAAFPKVAVEDYANQIEQAKVNLAGYITALNNSSAFDPERLQGSLEMEAQLAISKRELGEIRTKAKRSLSPTEFAELNKQLLEYEKKYVDKLKEQVKLKQQLLPLSRAVTRVEELGKNIDSLNQNNEASKRTLEVLSQSANSAYNPERMEIYLQFLTDIARIEKDLPQYKAQLLPLLERERKLREESLVLTKAASAVRDMQQERTQLPFSVARDRLQVTGDMAKAFGNENDFLRNRLIEAEIKIAQRRIQLEQDETLSREEVAAELGRYAAAHRAAAGDLAKLDQDAQRFGETMSLIKDVSRTLSDGYKNVIKTALKGGDIGEAMNGLLENVADKFLSVTLDAAFKPFEAMWQEQLKGLFGVKDPMATLAEQQLASEQALQETQKAITTQQQEAARTQLQAANTQLQAAQGAVPIEVIPYTEYKPSSPTNSINTPSPEKTINTFSETMQKATTGLAIVATTAMSIVGGIQQVKRGGTFNVLMGLAGIFSGIGGITGALGKGGSLSGLFKASGGPVTAHRPYIVGERGFEIFEPTTNGRIIPNAQSRALLDSRQALTKQLNPQGTFDPSSSPEDTPAANPFLASRNALTFTTDVTRERNTERILATTLTATPKPLEIRYQSEIINQTEYVTAEQFQRGLNVAAERGRALTLGALKNSVKARRQAGI